MSRLLTKVDLADLAATDAVIEKASKAFAKLEKDCTL